MSINELIILLIHSTFLTLHLFKSACNSGDTGLIPGLRRSPEGGNGNPP